MKAKTHERTVVLGLSQKAAKVLDEIMEEVIAGGEFNDEWHSIFKAIRTELREQIATPKKKKGQKRGN